MTAVAARLLHHPTASCDRFPGIAFSRRCALAGWFCDVAVDSAGWIKLERTMNKNILKIHNDEQHGANTKEEAAS